MAKTSGASVRDIVVIADLHGDRRPTAVAIDLARATGAWLSGQALAFDPLVPVYTVAAPIPTDFIAAAHDQGVADAKAALAAFESAIQAAGVAGEGRIAESITGDGFASIARAAILSDLAVVGQSNPDLAEPLRAALIESLLFQAGVPTLVVPYSGAATFGFDTAVVAWNGSPGAGRAVRAALPLLSMARQVLVVIVEEGRQASADAGADIGAYLSRHDLNVTVRTIPNAPNGVGAALLAFAAEASASWLVMGAYGHSRIREFLLGGVTYHVLGNAALPVLMSH